MRYNWFIIIVFALVIIGISAAVIIGQNQPLDAQQLKSQLQNLQSAAEEGALYAASAGQLSERYYQAQLEDLQQNVDDSRHRVEMLGYDPSIAATRQKFLDTSSQLSDHLHTLSLSFHDPAQLVAQQDELQKIKHSLEDLLK